MVYAGAQESGDSDVRIYRFDDTASAGGALVVWAPTSNATVHAGYSETQRHAVRSVMGEEILPVLDSLGLGASHAWRRRERGRP